MSVHIGYAQDYLKTNSGVQLAAPEQSGVSLEFFLELSVTRSAGRWKNKKGGVEMRYFNTTLGISMLPDGTISVRTLSVEEAVEFLRSDVDNVANPSHANTLDAVSRRTGVDVRSARGGRVTLKSGDSCLVAEISGVPRETREFTDAEISAATFTFRLVEVQ